MGLESVLLCMVGEYWAFDCCVLVDEEADEIEDEADDELDDDRFEGTLVRPLVDDILISSISLISQIDSFRSS